MRYAIYFASYPRLSTLTPRIEMTRTSEKAQISGLFELENIFSCMFLIVLVVIAGDKPIVK